jgi:DNA helicase TIP49 (TBP-interacting protein)
MTYKSIKELEIKNGDIIRANFTSGVITNISNGKYVQGEKFSEVQLEIYQNGGLF